MPKKTPDGQSHQYIATNSVTSSSIDAQRRSTAIASFTTTDFGPDVASNLVKQVKQCVEQCVEQTLAPFVERSLANTRATPRISKWNVNKYDGNEANLDRYCY